MKYWINATLRRPQAFFEGQIWWCVLGENIGVEVDGKGEKLVRPVLIIKKTGGEAFIGIPTTSRQRPEKAYYYRLILKGFETTLLFSQVRAMDASRLRRRITNISSREFWAVKVAFCDYLNLVKNAEPSWDGSDKTFD